MPVMGSKHADVIVIGGGIIGLSAAHHLSRRKARVLVLEKQYPAAGSTGRCIGGIRVQFSTPASIRLMQESMAQFKTMAEEFGFSVEFQQGGYLFLAHSQEKLDAFIKVSAIQKSLGVEVRVMTAEACCQLVPGLNGDGLVGGVFGPEDGQAYPFKVLKGYMEGMRKNGSEIRLYTAVTGFIKQGDRIIGVVTEKGETLYADVVLNAAGPYAAGIGRMAGLDIKVVPERHEAFITDRLPPLFDPMLVDYRPDGCYFQQMATGQVIGCYTPVPNVPGNDQSSTIEFMGEMARRSVRLMPDLAKARVIRHWAGSYENTPDLSPIIDKTPVKGFYVACGMSGHGFMFGPAVGKFVSQIILDDSYPYEWSEFKLDRDYSRLELMK
jgi:sarcosine oxidase subunit beta